MSTEANHIRGLAVSVANGFDNASCRNTNSGMDGDARYADVYFTTDPVARGIVPEHVPCRAGSKDATGTGCRRHEREINVDTS